MKILVDTCIWSLALRRKLPDATSVHLFELQELLKEFRIVMIGAIRQEILSGIKEIQQFNLLRDYLKGFPDLALNLEDYELAAGYFNQCQRKGIQGSNTDFLLCAIATNHHIPIYTVDQDFELFQKVLPINLHKPRAN